MNPELTKPPGPEAERVRISCPGCGRHDYVTWPAGQPTYHWKCFNCSKEFDLHRKGGH
jgi:ribosomal protein S27E